MSTRHAEADLGVQRITAAPEAGHVDRDARFVRYAWQMGIRTVCFILAFFTQGWLQIVCFIAAIVLPYIAVALANNGGVTNAGMMQSVPEDAPPAHATPSLTGRDTVPGQTVDHRELGR